MTLHWWMHWFWVTLWLVTCFIDGVPLSSTIDGFVTTSSTEEDRGLSPLSLSLSLSTTEKSSLYTVSSGNVYPDTSSKQNFRIPKAIGINPTISTTVDDNIKQNYRSQFSKLNGDVLTINKGNADNNDNGSGNSVLKIKNESQSSSLSSSLSPSSSSVSNDTNGGLNSNNNSNNKNNSNNSNNSNNRKDSKLTWIFTGNKTSGIPVKIIDGDHYRKNVSLNNNGSSEDDGTDHDLAVLPLGEPTPTRFKLVLNKTNKFIPSNILNGDKIFNKSEDVEISDDVIETSILATAASILQDVSESPRLSRARSAFPSDYQQDQQDKNKDDNYDFGNATSSAVDIAAVTGSCLATIVLIGTMGSLGFVMYRRRYLNPPQTLNSDKCSNPDSSGYIDDSTIRDNSEEMYSLDNDSFLNSLEAMTIQNYWTDSVKHTKL